MLILCVGTETIRLHRRNIDIKVFNRKISWYLWSIEIYIVHRGIILRPHCSALCEGEGSADIQSLWYQAKKYDWNILFFAPKSEKTLYVTILTVSGSVTQRCFPPLFVHRRHVKHMCTYCFPALRCHVRPAEHIVTGRGVESTSVLVTTKQLQRYPNTSSH